MECVKLALARLLFASGAYQRRKHREGGELELFVCSFEFLNSTVR